MSRYNAEKRLPHDPRNTERWKRLRVLYIGAHPICERCGERFSQQVHHKVGVLQGGDCFDDREGEGNLIALCNRCHHNVE